MSLAKSLCKEIDYQKEMEMIVHEAPQAPLVQSKQQTVETIEKVNNKPNSFKHSFQINSLLNNGSKESQISSKVNAKYKPSNTSTYKQVFLPKIHL